MYSFSTHCKHYQKPMHHRFQGLKTKAIEYWLIRNMSEHYQLAWCAVTLQSNTIYRSIVCSAFPELFNLQRPLVCKFDIEERNFILISCLFSSYCALPFFFNIFLLKYVSLWNDVSIISICTFIFHRRILYLITHVTFSSKAHLPIYFWVATLPLEVIIPHPLGLLDWKQLLWLLLVQVKQHWEIWTIYHKTQLYNLNKTNN